MFKQISASALICAMGVASIANAEEAIDPESLFNEAMELRESGQLFNSIETFETILSSQPGLNRVRLELAVAYHRARQYQDAREQLTKVLNDPETPENVKLSITGYLAQLGSDEKSTKNRSSSSIFVSAGVFNDTNVTLGPSIETATATQEKSGGGIVGMASFSHLSRSSDPIKSDNKLIDIEWATQITAYDKSFTTASESDYNVQALSLTTGPRLVSDKSWQFSFDFKIDRIFFGGNPYSKNIGLNPKFVMSFENDIDISFEAQATVNEYADTANDGLDGISKKYGFGVSKFYKKRTIGIDAGVRYHSNGADDDDLNATGIEIYLGGQMPTWENARAYVDLSSREYEYLAAGINTNGKIRDETELTAVVGVSHDFKSGILKSWSLNGQITYKDNDSNVSNFNYDQVISEVNLRRYF